jgi:hypothetical protein
MLTYRGVPPRVGCWLGGYWETRPLLQADLTPEVIIQSTIPLRGS